MRSSEEHDEAFISLGMVFDGHVEDGEADDDFVLRALLLHRNLRPHTWDNLVELHPEYKVAYTAAEDKPAQNSYRQLGGRIVRSSYGRK